MLAFDEQELHAELMMPMRSSKNNIISETNSGEKSMKKPHLQHYTQTWRNKFCLFVWLLEHWQPFFFISSRSLYLLMNTCTSHVVNKMVVVAMSIVLCYVLLTTSWFARFQLVVYFGHWNTRAYYLQGKINRKALQSLYRARVCTAHTFDNRLDFLLFDTHKIGRLL